MTSLRIFLLAIFVVASLEAIEFKTMKPFKFDKISEMDLRIYKPKKPCYFYGKSMVFLEKERVSNEKKLKDIKDGSVVGYIEHKFQAKGILGSPPVITKQEIRKQMIPKEDECIYQSKKALFENSKTKYKSLYGEHFYIRLIQP